MISSRVLPVIHWKGSVIRLVFSSARTLPGKRWTAFSINQKIEEWWGWTDTPTGILPEGSARCVQSFDDSLILQFAWRIAFHCVLHRCGSQDIHCWKCLTLFIAVSKYRNTLESCLWESWFIILRYLRITKRGLIWVSEDTISCKKSAGHKSWDK